MPVADELCDLGDSLMALVDRDVDVALFMTIRHNEPRFALYALLHAIHTATVAQILARQLDWPEARVARLVRAALTMNASMLELQATLAMQRDPPSAKQRQQIHDHPTQSARLLRAAGVTDETWLEAVEQHHERSGGGGYPAGLQAVGEIAHALRTADVFTAKISERAFRAALPVQSAVRQLFDEEKGGAMAAGLIRALGLYPPGDLVQLKNGELAVVTRRGPTATTPMAAAISDSRGKLTVATPVRDTRQPEFAIAGAAKELPPHLRVLPERVYGWLDA
jgi:HD-GYP domain-containing protein (c-di-GMP phosphodiesterase class II)